MSFDLSFETEFSNRDEVDHVGSNNALHRNTTDLRLRRPVDSRARDPASRIILDDAQLDSADSRRS